MKPTRIIEEPRVICHGSKSYYEIKCDNGQDYNMNQLVAITGICRSCLTSRIRKDWRDPDIFSKKLKNAEEIPSGKQTNTEWQSLSGRVRTMNLLKIPVGSWEQQQLVIDADKDGYMPPGGKEDRGFYHFAT
jgi:hypothetical protein